MHIVNAYFDDFYSMDLAMILTPCQNSKVFIKCFLSYNIGKTDKNATLSYQHFMQCLISSMNINVNKKHNKYKDPH